MPQELAFGQISSFVERFEEAKIVSAEIYLRDGLPALKIYSLSGYSHQQVPGYLLFPRDGEESALIEVANLYEGSNYRLQEVQATSSTGENIGAVTFAGAKIDQSNPEPWEGNWSSAHSPLLGYGYPNLVLNLKITDLRVPKGLSPGSYWKAPVYWNGEGSWPGLLRIEGDYLTLTSIFEYVLSLRFGSKFGSNVTKRLNAITEEPEMQQAFSSIVIDEIWDVRKVTNIREGKTSPTNLVKSIQSCYEVRSNLTHRGKSIKSDAMKVINATKLLSELLTSYLLVVLPELKKIWPTEMVKDS